MKKITYKPYTKKNLPDLLKCVEALQDYLIGIDPMHRTRRLGPVHITRLEMEATDFVQFKERRRSRTKKYVEEE